MEKFVEIPVAEATVDQLRQFATENLGLDIHHNTGEKGLRAKIAQVWPRETIRLLADDKLEHDHEGAPPHQAGPPLAEKHIEVTAKDDKEVTLILQIVDEPGGEQPVPLGVNGRVMLVPRGKEVTIPHRYFEVLKNAIKHVYDPMPDGGMNPIPRKVSSYPFQRIA